MAFAARRRTSEGHGSQSSVRYLLRRELVAMVRPENPADDRSNLRDWAKRLLNQHRPLFSAPQLFSLAMHYPATARALSGIARTALASCPVAT